MTVISKSNHNRQHTSANPNKQQGPGRRFHRFSPAKMLTPEYAHAAAAPMASSFMASEQETQPLNGGRIIGQFAHEITFAKVAELHGRLSCEIRTQPS